MNTEERIASLKRELETAEQERVLEQKRCNEITVGSCFKSNFMKDGELRYEKIVKVESDSHVFIQAIWLQPQFDYNNYNRETRSYAIKGYEAGCSQMSEWKTNILKLATLCSKEEYNQARARVMAELEKHSY